MRFLTATAAIILACTTHTLRANTVTFSLVNPVQYGLGYVTFYGTLSVSADSTEAYSFGGAGSYFLAYNHDRYGTGTPYFFFQNDIPTTYLPGETYTGPFFSVGFSNYNPSYSGVFTLYGYFGARTPDFDPSTPLAPTPFTVIYGTPSVVTAATPEPSSFVLLGTAAAALLGLARRRLKPVGTL